MKVRVLVLGLVGILAGTSGAWPAQVLSLSLRGGALVPSGEAYRRIYGSGFQYAADVWLKFRGPFGLAAGFEALADEGAAVPLSGGQEIYPVEFRRTSVPVVAFYERDLGRFTVRAGAGLGIHSYKESWQTADLAFKGHKVTPRAVAAVAVKVTGRVSALVSVTYDGIRTGELSSLGPNIGLGGVLLLGGLSLRIF